MGRATQGVRLITLRGDDQIASVCRVPKSDDEELLEDEGAAVSDSNDAESSPENSAPPEE